MKKKTAILSLLFLALVSCGTDASSLSSRQGSSASMVPSSLTPEEEASIQEAKIRKEIILAQVQKTKETLGDAYYDFMLTNRKPGDWLNHYKYDIDSVLTVLKRHCPEENVSALENLSMLRINYELMRPYNVCDITERDASGNIVAMTAKNEEHILIDRRLNEDVRDHVHRAVNELESLNLNTRFVVEEADFSEATTRYPHTSTTFVTIEDYAAMPYDWSCGFNRPYWYSPSLKTAKKYPLLENVVRAAYSKNFVSVRVDYAKGSWLDGLTNFLTFGEYNRISLRDTVYHELAHSLYLDDLYVQEGYNEGAYHPNSGDSIMDPESMTGTYLSQGILGVHYTDRDKRNLQFVYGGGLYRLLEEIDQSVRASFAS